MMARGTFWIPRLYSPTSECRPYGIWKGVSCDLSLPSSGVNHNRAGVLVLYLLPVLHITLRNIEDPENCRVAFGQNKERRPRVPSPKACSPVIRRRTRIAIGKIVEVGRDEHTPLEVR